MEGKDDVREGPNSRADVCRREKRKLNADENTPKVKSQSMGKRGERGG
jgi:hypothetical protein